MADREGLGHAQRLREVATMLRGAKLALEADAACDCDRAAEWIVRHSRTVSDVFAEREPLLDARGVPVARTPEPDNTLFGLGLSLEDRSTAGVRVDAAMPDEIDLNGRTDAKDAGIEYLGMAKRQVDGKYRVLANVHGALCTVEVSVTPAGVAAPPQSASDQG